MKEGTDPIAMKGPEFQGVDWGFDPAQLIDSLPNELPLPDDAVYVVGAAGYWLRKAQQRHELQAVA